MSVARKRRWKYRMVSVDPGHSWMLSPLSKRVVDQTRRAFRGGRHVEGGRIGALAWLFGSVAEG